MDILRRMLNLASKSPPKKKRRGPQIGTVIEIKTSKGLAYAQYTHDGEGDDYTGFEIMRQIEGFYPDRPTDFHNVIAQKTRYHFHFFLKHALKDKAFEAVGNFPVPQKDQEIPKFRTGLNDPRNDNRVVGGFVFQGTKTIRAPTFTEEQFRLSMGGVWGYPLLVENLEIGWRPELDPSVVGSSNYTLNEARNAYLKKVGRTDAVRRDVEKGVTQYFLFKSKASANGILEPLKTLGIEPEGPESADDKQWLVVARQKIGRNFNVAESDIKMLALAKKHGGVYDGSETYTGT
jgi:hypothetical protein